MNKIFYLHTCSTCQRILNDTGTKDFELQDIKTKNVCEEELDFMAEKLGSYDALFSRRALKYKELGLKDMHLSERDFRRLILNEYTFLKRPVYVIRNEVFAGNDAKTLANIKSRINV